MKLYTKKVNFVYKSLFKKLFEETLFTTQNQVSNVSIGITFVDENEIKLLNKQHRDIDKVTDVLSFPMLEIDYKKSKLKDFEAERDPSGELYIGDIAVCTKRAKEQAKEYGHSYKRELCFLVIHGFLHCLGYDHIENDDEKVMMALAEQILADCKVKRGGKNV